MGRSAGTGSPVWWRCAKARTNRFHDRHYSAELTGRTRPYRPPSHSVIGQRSVHTSYEYVCSACGHRGWSNHMDLAYQAKDTEALLKRGRIVDFDG